MLGLADFLDPLRHRLIHANDPPPGGGVTDHGDLTGLADDDHPQYQTSAEVDTAIAAHAAAGDPHTSYATDADLATHAAAADPHTGYLKETVISGMAAPTIALGATAAAGSATTTISSDATIDAFDTTAPNIIEPDDPAAVGVINFAARRDHEHGIVTAIAGASAFADSAAEGTATSFSRSDHKHSREANPVTAHEAAGDPHPTYETSAEAAAKVTTHEAAADPHTGYLKESVISGLATPAIILGSSAAAGSTLTPIRSDSTIAAFDATNPSTQAFADAAVVGTAAFAARRDHKHAMMADPVTAHAAAADPHTGYQKESEKSAASGYASLDTGTKVPTAELGGAGADATKFLRGDQTWAVPAGGGGGGETDPIVWMGGV